MTKLLLFVLFAGVAFCDPILVNTHGEFWLDNFMDGNVLFSLSGSSATGSVSFGGDIELGTAPPDQGFSANSFHGYPLQIYTATVDGITSHLWSLSLDSTGGYLEILDNKGNVAVREDIALAAPIQYTSLYEYGTRWLPNGSMNDEWEESGYFSTAPVSSGSDPVSDVSETGTGLLATAGLALG